MTERTHTIATKVFLAANSLFWLPWGFINLLKPESWAGDVIEGLDVYDLSDAVARTEVRAMYGGLQMAIGVLALLGAFSASHRRTVLLFFAIALTGLSACRLAGMIIEGDSSYLAFAIDGIPAGKYKQAGLAMYELPNMLLAYVLVLAGWRYRPASRVEALKAENERLRSELVAAQTDV